MMRESIYKRLCIHIGRNIYSLNVRIGMSLKSKTSIARPGSKSLRATVPEGIAVFLELTEGAVLEWKMEIVQGERAVVVRKSKS
jgi:hypothetical protein